MSMFMSSLCIYIICELAKPARKPIASNMLTSAVETHYCNELVKKHIDDITD